jgi:hypothetical protein
LPARKNAIANVRQCRLLSPPVRPLAVTLAVQAVSGLAQAVRFFWPFLRIAACRQAVLTRPLRHNSISLLLLSATCAADRTDPANGRICPPSHSCGAAAMYARRTHDALTAYSVTQVGGPMKGWGTSCRPLALHDVPPLQLADMRARIGLRIERTTGTAWLGAAPVGARPHVPR